MSSNHSQMTNLSLVIYFDCYVKLRRSTDSYNMSLFMPSLIFNSKYEHNIFIDYSTNYS